jgi:hypothetical protein
MAGLYFGRDVLIPLSLAALITFLLAPLVSRLERWLGKVMAVLVAMSLLLGGAISLGWAVGWQAIDLANELPGYKENIRSKLRSFQLEEGGAMEKLSETMNDLKKDLPGNGDDKKAALGGASGEAAPVAVAVVDDETDGILGIFRSVAGPVLGPLATGALVVLLTTFMLLKRDDLQGRIIRLIGQGRISATTRAMDEAGTRVRRYLLMQLVINVTYGIPLAIGLYFIGVPNALLWGCAGGRITIHPVHRAMDRRGVPRRPFAGGVSFVDHAVVDPRAVRGAGTGEQQCAGAMALRIEHRRIVDRAHRRRGVLDLDVGSGRAGAGHALHRVPGRDGPAYPSIVLPQRGAGGTGGVDSGGGLLSPAAQAG